MPKENATILARCPEAVVTIHRSVTVWELVE